MSHGPDSLHWDPLVERIIALSRNAHRGVDRQDQVDYWYRLGQRNAYAHAAGVVIARGVDAAGFSAAERLTGALDSGVADLPTLRAFVMDSAPPAAAVDAALSWIGPAAFHAQFPPATGIDHDYGMRWGPRGDQRLTLRLPVAGEHGLLYAYDPTWDEYAVLSLAASTAAVERAFTRALQTDIHMSPASFAALVAQELATPRPAEPTSGLQVHL